MRFLGWIRAPGSSDPDRSRAWTAMHGVARRSDRDRGLMLLHIGCKARKSVQGNGRLLCVRPTKRPGIRTLQCVVVEDDNMVGHQFVHRRFVVCGVNEEHTCSCMVVFKLLKQPTPGRGHACTSSRASNRARTPVNARRDRLPRFRKKE